MADQHDPGADPQAIVDALQGAIDRGENVQVLRRAGAHPTWNGFPLALGDELVLMRSLHEFAVNGFAVMRLRDITAVLAADGLLHRPDLRASEQCLQMLLQLAGRAGAKASPGTH